MKRLIIIAAHVLLAMHVIRGAATENDTASCEGHEQLCKAVEQVNLHRLRALLWKGVKVNVNDCRAKGKTCKPCLHFAIQQINPGLVSILLANQAFANDQFDDGFTPITYAQKLQDDLQKKMKMFAPRRVCMRELGARYTDKKVFPSTQSIQIDLERIQTIKKALLEKMGNTIDHHLVRGSTPLCWAAQKGNEQAVHAALALGADTTFKSTEGTTPLHLAISLKHDDLFYQMIESTDRSKIDCCNRVGYSLVAFAALRKNISIVKKLLILEADPYKTNKNGWSAVTLAAYNRCSPMMRILQKEGKVDINLPDDQGRRPIERIKTYFHWNMNLAARKSIKFLKECGAQEGNQPDKIEFFQEAKDLLDL